MAVPNPKTKLVEQLSETLLAAGWQRRTKTGIFTKPLDSDQLGWLSVNPSTHGSPDTVWFDPKVGVVDVEVEHLQADFLGEKFSGYGPPTLMENVTALKSGQEPAPTWEVKPGSDADRVVAGLSDLLLSVGAEWINQHQTREQLVQAMDEGAGLAWVIPYTKTLLLQLMGRTEETQDQLRKLENGEFFVDPDQSQQWLERWEAHFGDSDPSPT